MKPSARMVPAPATTTVPHLTRGVVRYAISTVLSPSLSCTRPSASCTSKQPPSRAGHQTRHHRHDDASLVMPQPNAPPSRQAYRLA